MNKMKMKKIATSALLSVIVLGAVAVPALAAEFSAGSKGSVDFRLSTELDPKPFDPTDPTVPPAEVNELPDGEGKGSTGLLRFDRVPNLKFETIEIGSATQTGKVLQEEYTDKATGTKFHAAPTVEVTDNRGSGAGWTTFVSADGILDNGVAGSVKITGYELKLNNAEVSGYSGIQDEASKKPVFNALSINDQAQKFATAAQGNGMSSWGISFYDGTVPANGKPEKNTTGTATASEAVTLKIPQGATMETGKTYKTNLTWYLAVTPDATAPTAP